MKKSLTTLLVLLQFSLFAQIITNQDKLGVGFDFGPSNGFFLQNGTMLFCSSSDSIIGGDKNIYGNGGIDAWIVNMEYNHQVQWQKCIGGNDEDKLYLFQELPNGEFLFGGSSKSQPSGDKQSQNFGNNDVWLVKTDNQGNIIWEKSFGGDQNDEMVSLTVVNNSIYLLCDSRSGVNGNKTSVSHGYNDIWLIKTDLNGIVEWQNSYGGIESDYAHDLTIYNNNIFISSSSYSGVSGNKTAPTFTSDYTSDSWILKLDTNGNILDQASFGGTKDERGAQLYNINNKLFITDVSFSEVDTGNKSTPNYGLRDGRLLEINSNLNKLREYSFGGTELDDLQLLGFNSLNQMILSSNSRSDISGNKTVQPNGTFNGNFYPSDLWLIIFDTITNTFVHQQSIGGNEFDFMLNGQINSNESISFILISESDISGDKTIPLTPFVTSSTYIEFWTFNYTYDVSTDNLELTNSLNVYPNPFENKIKLNEEFAGNVVEFYNAQGSLVKRTLCSPLGEIETTNLPEGLYILNMTDKDGNVYTTRVIKQ